MLGEKILFKDNCQEKRNASFCSLAIICQQSIFSVR